MDTSAPKQRILVLGGGFGGVYTARHLERLVKRRADVEIVLVSRDNFLLMTPLLFEVCSGTLDVRPGMMGSLGHSKAFGQLLKLRVHGVPAWCVRRAYYLMQMPGWSRRLRILSDWAFALLLRPDIVKVSLDSEAALLLREGAAGAAVAKSTEDGAGRSGAAADHGPRGDLSGIQLTHARVADSTAVGDSLHATGGSA